MSITTEIERIQIAKSNLKDVINEKVDTQITDERLDNYAEKIKDVYDAGKRAIVDSIDGLYRFFSNGTATGQNMELLPYVLARDWQGKKINMQYTFQGSEKITEFTDPFINIQVSSPHGMFSGCKKLKSVLNLKLDEMLNTVVLTDLFNGCSALENCGTINFSGVTAGARTFTGCTSLKEIQASGEIVFPFDFGDCESLSKASVTSIIGALSTTKTDLTLRINNNAVISNFTEAEWAELIKDCPNWNISRI